MVKTRSQHSHHDDIAATRQILLNLRIRVFFPYRPEQSLNVQTDRYATFGEIKQDVASRLGIPFTSRIDVLDGESGNRILQRNDDDIIGKTFYQNEIVRVRVTRSESVSHAQQRTPISDPPADNYTNRPARPPPRQQVSASSGSLIGSAARSVVDYMSSAVYTEEVYDDQHPEFRRQLQAALEASNVPQPQPTTGHHDDIPRRSCRESWGVGQPRRKQHPALPSSSTMTSSSSTTATTSPRSVLEDYGRIVGRGTISQYTQGGVSACTSICLMAAQYFLQQSGDDTRDILSTEMLDFCVLEGSRYHSTLRSDHTGLEDVWTTTCPFIEGLERGLPYQNIVSVDNYYTALTTAWRYAVDRGQNAVAVVLTKTPETILCFGKSDDQSGPEWFLFDSHGDAHMQGDKVVYVLRVPSTQELVSALAMKYPPMDLGDVDEEYMLQLYGQFETTPIIIEAHDASAKPTAIETHAPEPTPEPEYVHPTETTHAHDTESTLELEQLHPTPTTDSRGPDRQVHSTLEVHDDHVVKSLTEMGQTIEPEEETEKNGKFSYGIQGEVSPTRTSDVVEVVSIGNEDQEEPKVPSKVAHVGSMFLRAPEDALPGTNDILVATSLCHEDEFVDLSHACEENGELRCMVTSCCTLIPITEAPRNCHRCGRLCCQECGKFGVSSADSCDDDLLSVCLECASDLLNAIDLSNVDARKTKAKVIKQVLGPRYEAIFEQAKHLLAAREDSSAARMHNDALNEIQDKIRILEEEKSILQSSPMVTHIDPDGDYVMDTSHSVEVISASRQPDPPQRSRQHSIMSGDSSDTFDEWFAAFQTAGRDRYPLPFALQYPTPLMAERRKHLIEDLQTWLDTNKRQFDTPYLAKREQLQEKRACLIEEVTSLRAYHTGSSHNSDDERVFAARSRSVGNDTGSTREQEDDESIRRSRVDTTSHTYNASVECCPRCGRTGPFPLHRGMVFCPHCAAPHQHDAAVGRFEY